MIETYAAMLPFPTTKRMVDNYIYRFLNKINRLDLAETYDLMPFEITTQTITMGLLFVSETYETVIQNLQKVLDSGMWG